MGCRPSGHSLPLPGDLIHSRESKSQLQSGALVNILYWLLDVSLIYIRLVISTVTPSLARVEV